MILFMKKHIVKLLITLGVVLLVFFAIYTQKNNIPTQNTWAAFLGFVLFYAPVLTGMWIASERMKERKRTLSKVLKGIIIFICFSMGFSFITFLFML